MNRDHYTYGTAAMAVLAAAGTAYANSDEIRQFKSSVMG